MEASTKSALITGGASGMGFAVAEALSKRGGWHLHLLDLNAERGKAAAKALGDNATFYEVNILDYDSFANIFQTVYDSAHRLDFVFANAGIIERFNFYEQHPSGKPPPPPDQKVIDVNLKSVINTVWLAQHYFKQSTVSEDKNIVMTASSGGLYRVEPAPSYCAAKHGVVGLMRSIAPTYYKSSGIRVNAICPGAVRTNLMEDATWDTLATEAFIPLEKIASTVTMLIDGYDVGGKEVGTEKPLAPSDKKLYGQAVELSGTSHYYRPQPGFVDALMTQCMEVTEGADFSR